MKKKVVDDSVKFAWAYLILHGKVTTGEWSYYGSSYEPDGKKIWDWKELQAARQTLADKVASVGIDWSKTDVPAVSNHSTFNGTFNSGGTCLGTLGTLVLCNGETILLGSSDDDAAHLAETARAIMKGRGNAVTILAEKL